MMSNSGNSNKNVPPTPGGGGSNDVTIFNMMNSSVHQQPEKLTNATVFDMMNGTSSQLGDATVLDMVKNKPVEQTFSEPPVEARMVSKRCSCGNDQSTVLYEPGLTDISKARSEASRYRISQGQTKVVDGDLMKRNRIWAASRENLDHSDPDRPLVSNNTNLGMPCDSCWDLNPRKWLSVVPLN